MVSHSLFIEHNLILHVLALGILARQLSSSNRWTDFLKGKRTTKTITKEAAEECERRIKNYRALQGQLDQIIEEALENAPWKES